jgi:hypothetical protein
MGTSLACTPIHSVTLPSWLLEKAWVWALRNSQELTTHSLQSSKPIPHLASTLDYALEYFHTYLQIPGHSVLRRVNSITVATSNFGLQVILLATDKHMSWWRSHEFNWTQKRANDELNKWRNSDYLKRRQTKHQFEWSNSSYDVKQCQFYYWYTYRYTAEFARGGENIAITWAQLSLRKCLVKMHQS